MAWHIKVFSRNGSWHARLDTDMSRTIKLGPARDSQEAATGALVNLYPEYFGIQSSSVISDEEAQEEKVGY